VERKDKSKSISYLHSSTNTSIEAVPSQFPLRFIRSVSISDPSEQPYTRADLDSHADTCCAGSDAVIIALTGRTVSVRPYSDEYKALPGIPIATAALAWDDPKTGQTYCLILNECLYLGKHLRHSLLNPNQLRANGVRVDDVPRQFSPTSTHSIFVQADGLTIPLQMHGVISGFLVRSPTPEELRDCKHIELTSDFEWDPSSRTFADKEDMVTTKTVAVAGVDTMIESLPLHDNDRYISVISSLTESRQLTELEDDFTSRLISQVRVAADDIDGDGLSGHADGDVYHVEDSLRSLFALSTEEKRSVITPEVLSRRWGIGLAVAKRTLSVTTQAGIRNVLAPTERRSRQRYNHLQFPTLRADIYSDTMFTESKKPSLQGYTAAQVFTNGKGFDCFYPIKTKGLAHEALTHFIQDSGIPKTIITDNAREETDGEWGRICRKHRIQQKVVAPYSQWANLAEASIREIKKSIRRLLRKTTAPRRLWCYAGQWLAAVRRLTALDLPSLRGRVPLEAIGGQTPDISEYAQFDWYENVYYMDPAKDFPFEKKTLGKWLGVATNCTQKMTFFVLGPKGKVVMRSDVWALTRDELNDPVVKDNLRVLDDAIKLRIGDTVTETQLDPTLVGADMQIPDELFGDHDADDADEPAEPHHPPTPDEFTPEAYDEYLTAEVLLPEGGEYKKARVISRKRDADGLPIGLRNPNPILDSREYVVEFPDGSTDAVTANIIAENMYSQIDSEGRSYAILDEITDHRTNGHALCKDDGFVIDRSGRRRHRITTQGWELQVTWRDGSTSWVSLKDLKESNPVEVAEYAVANKVAEEPAFVWWVRQVLRRRDRIIKKVKSRYWAKTHKFGIELPKSVKHALEIDARTGTDFWRKAIEKEMRNVMMAFEFRDDNIVPIGYKLIECHMIFDVKMCLTRKARLVAGGHMTDPPKESTYSSVVSRDSVRIAFTIAALNGLDILSADVQNAYLNAPTEERLYIIAGMEFGAADCGRPVLIVRALYGLRSSGARWRDHMANTLREGGFTSCRADPDVWMRKQTKPNGDKYWEYVLVYVDDILVISHDPQSVMGYLSLKYTLKEGSVKEPDTYLGADIRRWTIDGAEDSTKTRWAMSSDTYVKRAVDEVERELELVGQRLVTRVTTPMSAGYRPELDVTPELDARRANYFQGLIGILRWMCELGRIDIIVPVAMLSRFLAAPRNGHLEQCFHIFAYLKQHDRSSVVFDDQEPTFDESSFTKADWSEFYPDAKEQVPPNAPELRGQTITMSCFVDADHAGCRATRRSHSGVLIYINRAPIVWYSKRQNTVESSTFGSEFIAMKQAVDLVEGLRYKLRMMGVEVDGPTNLFCDNEAVVCNSTKPESTLKKKHNSIAYHRVREALAAKIVRVAKESGLTNLADGLTKCLPGPRLKDIFSAILW